MYLFRIGRFCLVKQFEKLKKRTESSFTITDDFVYTYTSKSSEEIGLCKERVKIIFGLSNS